jgi:hypothetical protein
VSWDQSRKRRRSIFGPFALNSLGYLFRPKAHQNRT